MNSTQIIILFFGILYFTVVVLTRRKGNFEEFSVAGRGLGTFLIFSTICATYIGPGWTLGLTRDGFNNGMFLGMIAPIAGIGLIIIALTLAPAIRNKFLNSFSIGDIVGGSNSHNHRIVRITTGIINLLLLSSVVTAMSYAGGELINNVFGFSKIAAIAIMTTIVTIYSFYGGIRATIQTDLIQFLHFIILIPLLAVLMLANDSFDWISYQLHVTQRTNIALDSGSSSLIFGTLLLYLLAHNGLDSTTLNRFLASRNGKVAKNAAFYAGIFIFFWVLLMIFIGSVGAYLYPEFTDSDQILLNIAEQNFHGVFYGIFIIAMIGVVMSTQDTLINGAGVSFSQDIIEAINPEITDEKKLLYSKAYTIGLGVVAIIVASFLDSILDVIMAQLEYYIPIMAPIVFFSIVKKKHNWQSAMAGMAGGFISFIFWENVGNVAMPTILVALIGNVICYLLTDNYLNLKHRNPQTT